MESDLLGKLISAFPSIIGYVSGSAFIIYFLASLVIKKYIEPEHTLLKRWNFLGAIIVTLLSAVSMIILMEVNQDISYLPHLASKAHMEIYYFMQIIYSVAISSIMRKGVKLLLWKVMCAFRV